MKPTGYLALAANVLNSFECYSLFFFVLLYDTNHSGHKHRMRNKPTGCPFHHAGLNFSSPESEKCAFKSTSYMLLSMIP